MITDFKGLFEKLNDCLVEYLSKSKSLPNIAYFYDTYNIEEQLQHNDSILLYTTELKSNVNDCDLISNLDTLRLSKGNLHAFYLFKTGYILGNIEIISAYILDAFFRTCSRFEIEVNGVSEMTILAENNLYKLGMYYYHHSTTDRGLIFSKLLQTSEEGFKCFAYGLLQNLFECAKYDYYFQACENLIEFYYRYSIFCNLNILIGVKPDRTKEYKEFMLRLNAETNTNFPLEPPSTIGDEYRRAVKKFKHIDCLDIEITTDTLRSICVKNHFMHNYFEDVPEYLRIIIPTSLDNRTLETIYTK